MQQMQQAQCLSTSLALVEQRFLTLIDGHTTNNFGLPLVPVHRLQSMYKNTFYYTPYLQDFGFRDMNELLQSLPRIAIFKVAIDNNNVCIGRRDFKHPQVQKLASIIATTRDENSPVLSKTLVKESTATKMEHIDQSPLQKLSSINLQDENSDPQTILSENLSKESTVSEIEGSTKQDAMTIRRSRNRGDSRRLSATKTQTPSSSRKGAIESQLRQSVPPGFEPSALQQSSSHVPRSGTTSWHMPKRLLQGEGNAPRSEIVARFPLSPSLLKQRQDAGQFDDAPSPPPPPSKSPTDQSENVPDDGPEETNEPGLPNTPRATVTDTDAAVEFLKFLRLEFFRRPWPNTVKSLCRLQVERDSEFSAKYLEWLVMHYRLCGPMKDKVFLMKAVWKLIYQFMCTLSCMSGTDAALIWDTDRVSQLCGHSNASNNGCKASTKAPKESPVAPSTINEQKNVFEKESIDQNANEAALAVNANKGEQAARNEKHVSAGLDEATSNGGGDSTPPVHYIETPEQLELVKNWPTPKHLGIKRLGETIKERTVAIKCDGVPGCLNLVSIACPTAIYLLDTAKLDPAAACKALIPLLSDLRRIKVFHSLGDISTLMSVGGVNPCQIRNTFHLTDHTENLSIRTGHAIPSAAADIYQLLNEGAAQLAMAENFFKT